MARSSEFLDQQQERLEQERQRIEDELARIAKKDPKVPDDYDTTFPDYGRDPEENAMEEERYEAEMNVEHSLEAHLKEVRDALGRIEQGAYGTCRVCGTAISEERLQAFPAATTCLAHA